MIFKKKTVELNHGCLAAALISLNFNYKSDFIHSAEICKKERDYKKVIKMDEHIKFILSFFHAEEYGYSYFVKTFVNEIKVNEYHFIINREDMDSYFWKEWRLSSKKIYHPLPDLIIKKINDFSSKTIENSTKERQKKQDEYEQVKHKKWKNEERLLKKVFNGYDR